MTFQNLDIDLLKFGFAESFGTIRHLNLSYWESEWYERAASEDFARRVDLHNSSHLGAPVLAGLVTVGRPLSEQRRPLGN